MCANLLLKTKNRSRLFVSITSILGLALNANVVSAQANEGISKVVQMEDKVVYLAAYFSSFIPKTSLDMVEQIPGFTIAEQSSDRGFGQGASNFLINNKRPSLKSEETVDPLRRIPASSVVAIELLQNGSPELAGQTGYIVNVITARENAQSADWEVTFGGYGSGDFKPAIRTSMAGRLYALNYNVEVRYFRNLNLSDGEEILLNASGEPLQLRQESYRSPSDNYRFNLATNWLTNTGDPVNLNLSLGYSYWRLFEFSNHFDTNASLDANTLLRQTAYSPDNDWFPAELSGDYTFSLGEGKLKIIAIHNYDYRKRHNEYNETQPDGGFYRHKSLIPRKTLESILRGSYSLQIQQHSFDVAAEVAYNSLQTSPTFFEDTGDGLNQIDIAGSNVKVSERRYETSALYTYQHNNALTLHTNLALEYSKLGVRDVPDSERDYLRPKGFVAAEYAINTSTTSNVRLTREVGQLNLLDFTSFVTPSEGTQNTGNLDIVPEQKWRIEANLEHRFSGDNMLSLNLFKDFIEDKVAYIPFENSGEGLGNLPSSQRYGASVNLGLSGHYFGRGATKANIRLSANESKLTDPLTEVERKFDDDLSWQAEFSLRHDFYNTDWAVTGSITAQETSEIYRLTQINKYDDTPQYKVSLEHKDFFGARLNIDIENIFGVSSKLDRQLYGVNRLGEVVAIERRERQDDTLVMVSLSSTF